MSGDKSGSNYAKVFDSEQPGVAIVSDNVNVDSKTSNSKSYLPNVDTSVTATDSEVNSDAEDPVPVPGRKKSGYRKYIGLLSALLSAFMFSLIPLITKLVTRIHPLGQTVWRQVVSVIISLTVLTFLLRNGKGRMKVLKAVRVSGQSQIKGTATNEAYFNWKCVGLIVITASTTMTGTAFRMTALDYLSIADSTVLTYMSLIFIPIFAHFFLGEKCKVVPAFLVVLIICGVCIIAKPPFLTGRSEFDRTLWIGLGMKVADAFCLAIYSILLRKLRQVHSAIMNLAVSVAGLLIVSVAAYSFGLIKVPGTLYEAGFMVALGFAHNLAHLFLILALTFELAGTVSLMRASDVPLVFLWQILILGSLPDIWTITGSILVIIGVVLTSCRKWIQELPEDSKIRRRLSFLLL